MSPIARTGKKKAVGRNRKDSAPASFLNEPVSGFSQSPIVVYADDAVTDAAKLMSSKNCGSVLVSESAVTKNEPVGILTEWDLLSKVVAAERDGGKTRVREVMSSPVLKIEADTRVSDALRMMLNRGIRRLAVVEDGVLVGTVTQSRLTAGNRQRAASATPLVVSIKGHICPYCNLTFPTQNDLSVHIESMHEETRFLEMRDQHELEAE